MTSWAASASSIVTRMAPPYARAPAASTVARGPLTALTGWRRTTGGMKHLPEAHQSIAPDRAVVFILAAIVLVMAIVWVVVSLAE